MSAFIRAGNVEIIEYVRSNHYCSAQPLMLMALEYDQGPIFSQLYSSETVRSAVHTKLSEIIPDKPSSSIVKSMLEEGLLNPSFCRKILIKCLETGNDDVIDMIFNANTHMEDYGIGKVTYPESLKLGIMRGYELVFIKAAELGNMKVVQYYFDIDAINGRRHMQAALDKAIETNHQEIADFIRSKMKN